MRTANRFTQYFAIAFNHRFGSAFADNSLHCILKGRGNFGNGFKTMPFGCFPDGFQPCEEKNGIAAKMGQAQGFDQVGKLGAGDCLWD